MIGVKFQRSFGETKSLASPHDANGINCGSVLIGMQMNIEAGVLDPRDLYQIADQLAMHLVRRPINADAAPGGDGIVTLSTHGGLADVLFSSIQICLKENLAK